MMDNKIVAVKVYLSDNDPEDMLGVTRLSNIEIEYENGQSKLDDSYCNTEFLDDTPDDIDEENQITYPTVEERIEEFVARKLNVDIGIVQVVYNRIY